MRAVTKEMIVSKAEELQAMLRAFPRNGNDTAILGHLAVYIHVETKGAADAR